ncbi:MAG: YidC/Oxa1 family membrane protein insertase [Chloroflexota bacterium]|nr:membrane protein insertase YidC [Chloroflexota bacterium]
MGQLWDSFIQLFASVIKFFAEIVGGNTAIGIIVFTIVVRTALLPLTLKSVRSNRAMQQLQPLIKEINKGYTGKQSQEKTTEKQQKIMALYREYNVNPAAGCLPIVIQLPIFFAVYGAVSSVAGKVDPLMSYVQHTWNIFSPQAKTLADQAILTNRGILWINDLTLPDPTNILPIMMMVLQFMTTRMTIPRGGGADEQQRNINRIMQWTPLIFGLTALGFPVGSVIYWVTSSIFSVLQQYFITGWGSLADLPGLGFLPEKKLKTMELKKRDPNEPRKKTMMERLAENSERIQAERTSTASADGSNELEEEAPRNNFGRKSGGFDGRSNTSSKATSSNSVENTRKVQNAYNQLNRRPPKKSGGSGSNGTKKKK